MIDIDAFLKSVEATGFATRIRDSLFLFPMVESMHVVGLALVLGTIAVADLRLLGVASAQRSFQRISSDVEKWTWAAFALSALTGAFMFTTNARVYYHNFYFRTKMLLLALSAVNMLVFKWTAFRKVHDWDRAPSAPGVGRTVAVLSLVLWISIIFMGRMIGFTTSRAQVTPQTPPSVNFDDFLNGASPH